MVQSTPYTASIYDCIYTSPFCFDATAIRNVAQDEWLATQFEALKHMFDRALCSLFDKLKHISATNFCRGHVDALSMFMQRDHLEHVLESIKVSVDPEPDKFAHCFNSSTIGKKLFHNVASHMHYKLYVKEIEGHIDTVEHLNFTVHAVTDFDTLMRKEAATVTSWSSKGYQQKPARVKFLETEALPKLTCPDDEHIFRKFARMKQCALNAGDLEWMI